MTLQEKIEILDGVKDHPNKEKLVFEIDGEWVAYIDFENQIGFEISQSNSFSFIEELSIADALEKYGDILTEKDMAVLMNESAMQTFKEVKPTIGEILKEMYEESLKERTTYIYGGEKGIDLLNKMLKQE